LTVVVDTSAVLAMLLGEPEATRFGKILRDEKPAISAGSLIETLRVVLRRRGERARVEVYDLLSAFQVRVEPVDEAQVVLAEDGHLRFGKGRGRAPAVLNFGDLFAYALARHLNAPLLFKGNDFAQTDIKPALPA
jgi:ribonuclease VapC